MTITEELGKEDMLQSLQSVELRCPDLSAAASVLKLHPDLLTIALLQASVLMRYNRDYEPFGAVIVCFRMLYVKVPHS
jgi:hypothetical protein